MNANEHLKALLEALTEETATYLEMATEKLRCGGPVDHPTEAQKAHVAAGMAVVACMDAAHAFLKEQPKTSPAEIVRTLVVEGEGTFDGYPTTASGQTCTGCVADSGSGRVTDLCYAINHASLQGCYVSYNEQGPLIWLRRQP